MDIARDSSLRRRFRNDVRTEKKENIGANENCNIHVLYNSILSNENKLYILLLAFRVLNACSVCTFFNADEFWQSLEVAHKLVFGYGYLTWEWQIGLRSYLHPLCFALLYKILASLGLDTPYTLSMAPRVLQGVIAGTGDLFLYRLARKMHSQRTAEWTLFASLVSWFCFFCGVRSFSTCLESPLTLAALLAWQGTPLLNSPSTTPLSSSSSSSALQAPPCRRLALCYITLAFLVRPTALIFWAPVLVREALCGAKRARFIFCEALPVGLGLGLACTALDWVCYGRLVVVPWNFFLFNVMQGGGSHYGTHPPHWYFSQGLPATAWTLLPLIVLGVYRSKGGQRDLAMLALWSLVVLSCIGHKEFRFILPVLQILLIYAGSGLASLIPERALIQPSGAERRSQPTLPVDKGASWARHIPLVLVITQAPLAFYLSVVHQRAPLAVMPYLARRVSEGAVQEAGILFLTPCHATPWYSHIHSNISMHFLDCSPPAQPGDMDQSDYFFQDPQNFLKGVFGIKEFHPKEYELRLEQLPSHIVMFDDATLMKELHWLLASKSYCTVESFFNAHFAVDRGLQARLLVLEKGRSCSTPFISE